MVSCLASTTQMEWSVFLQVLSTVLFLRDTIPLKLGLMRASYSDVLPMSLSRKSDGDICGPALLGGFISSLQELSLKLEREGGGGGRDIFETAEEGVSVCMRGSSGGGAKKNGNSHQLSNQQKIPSGG